MRMPVIFVSHGAPTLLLDERRGPQLTEWGRRLPRPRAILVMSAHWEARVLRLGTTQPRALYYDFGGFDAELYRVEYPAPTAPWLADRIEALLGPVERAPLRAWDHGVWVPLKLMFPEADLPILQISEPQDRDGPGLVALGRSLAPLRDEGVLIVGSGGMVHNLREIGLSWQGETQPWASTFDRWAAEQIAAGNWDELAEFQSRAPDGSGMRAHPTAEHFRPLLFAGGAAGQARASFPVEGFDYLNLSMRSVQLDP